MHRRHFRAAIILAILLLTAGIGTIAAQSELTFFITEVDPESFPQVQFRLRAVSIDNQVVSGLTPADVTVYENGEQARDVAVSPHEDGPITYIFVIDLGRSSNFRSFGVASLRQVVSSLVGGGYFVDGRDTVMVLSRENSNSDRTVTLLRPTQSGADLTTWAASFSFERTLGTTKGLLAVEDAITQMTELVPIPGSQTTAIIYLTRYIEDPSVSVAPTSAQNTAAKARSNFTSIHVFHTDLAQFRRDALQILAEGSNGRYVSLDRNNFLSGAASLYQAIDGQRTYYQVAYRSPIAESAQREITVNSPGQPGRGVTGSYEIVVQPPSVSVVRPVPNSTIRREAVIGEEGGVPAFNITTTGVVAELTWPDGHPRSITSAQLLVNGAPEASIEPAEGQSSFEFEWDMSDVEEPGTNLVTLEVAVEDELGLTSSAQSAVNVEVILPPTPESGLANPRTLAAIGIPAICLVSLAVLAVGAAAIYFLRSSSTKPSDAAEQKQAEVVPTVFAAEVPDLVLATLTVAEGPAGMIGERLKIAKPKVSLGRDPSKTEISFYADKESSVSRVHCDIVLDDDNAFRLTDRKSSAGTRLNGRRIHPEVPVVLDDGDEIVLGDLAQRGVKLRFNFASEEDLRPYSGTADDRTHLLGDADPGESGGHEPD